MENPIFALTLVDAFEMLEKKHVFAAYNRLPVPLPLLPTVDGSEIPRPTTFWMVLKPLKKKWDFNYQPQLVSSRRISEPSTA